MNSNYLLTFVMQLDDTPKLNIGRLFLIEDNNKIINRWQCTSGLGDYQGIGDWSTQAKGTIPPNYELESEPVYQVSTNPVYQSLNGIETNTYMISPEQVQTKQGTNRSEFLIHASRYPEINAEGNLPLSGSLGCIVMARNEFKNFESTFKLYCEHLDYVNLLVGYVY